MFNRPEIASRGIKIKQMNFISGTYVKIKDIFVAVFKRKDGSKIVVKGNSVKDCNDKVKNNKVE